MDVLQCLPEHSEDTKLLYELTNNFFVIKEEPVKALSTCPMSEKAEDRSRKNKQV